MREIRLSGLTRGRVLPPYSTVKNLTSLAVQIEPSKENQASSNYRKRVKTHKIMGVPLVCPPENLHGKISMFPFFRRIRLQ